MAHILTKHAAALALATSLISGYAIAGANKAKDSPVDAIHVGQGVVCDTAEQVERFTALLDKPGGIEGAIKVVNSEVKNPRACGMVLAAFVRGDEVGEVHNGGRRLKVVEITILAVPVGNQWHFVSPLKQYTAFQAKGVEV